MGGSEFLIEEKLDGERMQLHKRGNEYFYCSRYAAVSSCLTAFSENFRKGKDYTYLYGKHIGSGSLTPYIDKAFDPRVDEYVESVSAIDVPLIRIYRIILDGEMLVWDPVSERNLPFGTLKTAALGRSIT